MFKIKSEQTHYTNDEKYPGSLKKANLIADELGMSVDRVLELANSHFMPHWRIDGGEPLFQLAEVKKWAAKNLIKRIDGQELPFNLKIMIAPPKAVDAPETIREIDNLKQVPINLYPPGIYFLVKDDEVVYVGQSVNPIARIGNHTDKDFDRAYMIPVPSSMLNDVEGALIRAINPPLNSGSRKIAVGPGNRGADGFILKKYAANLKIHAI